jgi:nitrogen fixation NifU-like protein
MYQDEILAHYRKPHGRGLPAEYTGSGERRNPLCGDHLQVAVVLDTSGDAPILREVGFDGRGCSIATASASMMTAAVQGLTREAALDLVDRVARLVRGEHPEPLATLDALRGVAPYPQRHGCALMPWQALRDALGADS